MLVAHLALGFFAQPPTARRRAPARSRATITLGPFAAFDRWYREHSLRNRWSRDWPERIILIRHGESLGNTDKKCFSNTPDSQIELTDRGYAQAAVAGMKLRKLVGNETVRFFHSPYMRTRQTLSAILKANFIGQAVQISSEPRLREQDFGNFQDMATMDAVFAERQRFGRFFYRFPDGEAGTDVFDRVATFLSYLWLTFGARGYHLAPKVLGLGLGLAAP